MLSRIIGTVTIKYTKYLNLYLKLISNGATNIDVSFPEQNK
jgi:hypothetical protein